MPTAHLVTLLVLVTSCGEKKQQPDPMAPPVASSGPVAAIDRATYKDVPAELTDARIEAWLKAMAMPADAADRAIKAGFKDEAELDLVNDRILEIAGEVMATNFVGKLESSPTPSNSATARRTSRWCASTRTAFGPRSSARSKHRRGSRSSRRRDRRRHRFATPL